MALSTTIKTHISGLLTEIEEAALAKVTAADVPLVGGLAKAAGALMFGELNQRIDSAIGNLNDIDAIADALDALEELVAVVENGQLKVTFAAGGVLELLGTEQFDLGASISAIDVGFNVSGSVGAALRADLNFTALIDEASGVTLLDTGTEEIKISLDGDISFDENTEASLGFLKITARDADVNQHEIHVEATVDLPQVTAANLSDAIDDIDLNFAGSAGLNLAIDVLPASFLPSISMNLEMGVGFNGDLSATQTTVKVTDISIDIRSVFGVFADLLGKAAEIIDTEPLGTILDIVTGPIPLLDPLLEEFASLYPGLDSVPTIPDGVISLLDLAKLKDQVTGAESNKLFDTLGMLALIRSIGQSVGETGKINLGDLDLSGGLANGNTNDLLDKLSGFSPESALGQLDAAIRDNPIFDRLSDQLEQNFSSNSGLEIPLLEDPTLIIQLLFNSVFGDVDIIRYELPELKFDAEAELFFPLLGPLGLTLRGEVRGELGMTIGYDTFGLSNSTGDLATDLLKGFFFQTDKNNDPINPDTNPTGYDAVAHVDGRISAGAALRAVVINASITGGIGFESIDAFFDIETPDGKMRLADLAECFVNVSGKAVANVLVEVEIGFGPFSFTERWSLVSTTLADFDLVECRPVEETSPPEMGLATLAPPNYAPTDLVLNTGIRAAERVFIDREGPEAVGTDVEEHLEIRFARDISGGPLPHQTVVGPIIPFALDISGFGISQRYGSEQEQIFAIHGKLGNFNDSVVMEAAIAIDAFIDGESGDDVISTGAGNDTITGGIGNDILTGNAGNDTLNGGDGNDNLDGGAGADTLIGGSGRDKVSYYNRAATDGVGVKMSLVNGAVVGVAGHAAGDTLSSIEYLVGTKFDDVLYASREALTSDADRSTVEGREGNDILYGSDNKGDLLIGGLGADALYGGAGIDATTYATSQRGVVVDVARGIYRYGEAEGDTLHSIEAIQGSSHADQIHGDAIDNQIDGFLGDDVLSGGGGRDKITGGDGNDTVYGGADGDTLDGGGLISDSTRDTLSYSRLTSGVNANLATGVASSASGTDTIVGAGRITGYVPVVNTPIIGNAAGYSTFENLTGSAYADTLVGDLQGNIIRGLAGNDSIDGGGGADTLIGGAGGDALVGGAGVDLADYSGSTGRVVVNLLTGVGSDGDAAGDTLATIENLRGTRRSDVLIGDANANEIDAGLSDVNVFDYVDGGAGTDRLVVDYSVGDTGQGVVGGFFNVSGGGTFRRASTDGASSLDGIDFFGIEALTVIGTKSSDILFGGSGDDLLFGEDGNDTILAGTGRDVVLAGAGNDFVAIGTDANRQLSANDGTRTTFAANGGDGIDTISLSLTTRSENIVYIGQAPTGGEFRGVNLQLADGSSVADFEYVRDLMTGNGDDLVYQAGEVDNYFFTAEGMDTIYVGGGNDFVDGGRDADGNVAFIFTEFTGNGLYLTDEAGYFAQNGDTLVVDLQNLAAGQYISSSAQRIENDLHLKRTVRVDGENGYNVDSIVDLYTTAGSYDVYDSSGALVDHTGFTSIERIIAYGSKGNDTLVGTYEQSGREDIAATLRGDDVLTGGDGNDVLYGLTGDDTLFGSAGNDRLVGTTNDRTENDVDTLWGGSGADTFVLGNATVRLYEGTSSHAVIKDFSRAEGDKIQLRANTPDETARDYGYIYTQTGSTVTIRYGMLNNPAFRDVVAIVENYQGTFNAAFDVDFVNPGFVLGRLANPGTDAPDAVEAAADNSSWQRANSALDIETSGHQEPPATLAAPDAAADQPAARTTLGSFTVEATNDTEALLAQLGTLSGITSIDLTIEGNAAATGTFSGDPFGLGSGIILSTGRVEDLVGPNTDGGGVVESNAEVPLTFTRLGRVGSSDIFMADLSNLGFDIKSLTVRDSNSKFGGGTGEVSGFDLDAIILSSRKLTPADLTSISVVNSLPRLSGLDFHANSMTFKPGTQRDPADPALIGTAGPLLVNASVATLNTVDGTGQALSNGVALGDGGSLGFDLTTALATNQPIYLYVAEQGSAGETLEGLISASSSKISPDDDLSTDFGMPGTEGDTTKLTYTFRPDAGLDQVQFQVVLFSEELPNFAGVDLADTFGFRLNGIDIGELSDGAAADMYNLMVTTYGPKHPDLVLNPAGTGPLADTVRANAYTTILTFTGSVIAGADNVLEVEVADNRDGFLDSGILIRTGSLVATPAPGSVTVVASTDDLVEGGDAAVITIDRPANAAPGETITVRLTANGDVVLGDGTGGNTIDVVFGPAETGPKTVTIKAIAEPGVSIPAQVTVSVTSSDPDFVNRPIAPISFEIIDVIETPENQFEIATLTAEGAPAGATLTWVVTGGADGSLFTIDPATGGLSFINPPDFENPADQGSDNLYDVIVEARLGSTPVDEQHLAVRVTDVAETSLLDVKFLSENAGFQNTLGWYDSRTGVGGIVFAEVDAWGRCYFRAGATAGFEVRTDAVPFINFFLIPDGGGLSQNSNSELAGGVKVIQLGDGRWAVATLNAQGNVELDRFGKPNLLVGANVPALFTEAAKNAGGLDYASALAGRSQNASSLAGDTADGPTGKLAWEDTAATRYHNGTYSAPGDADYDDAVFFVTEIKGKTVVGTDAGETLVGDRASDLLFGNAGNDILKAGDGNDRLHGGTGADQMYGGRGNDTYIVDDLGDRVFESERSGTDTVESSVSFTLGNDVENLTLTGTAAINGTGNSLANTLVGNDAANVLDGGVGADIMEGKGGDDTYVVGNVADVVIEAANGGTDTVQSTVSHALSANVENLTLTGSAASNGTGNALANVLVGNDAANLLDGAGGDDYMVGRGGDDTYIVGSAGDVVVETVGGGTDLVKSAVSYTLGSEVDNLALTGSAAINGTGNSLRNSLVGNSAANTLDGAAGADRLEGREGNDTYVVDNAGDVVVESWNGGTDTVRSTIAFTLGDNVENLTLLGAAAINGTGNALANILVGNDAANTLDGGREADRLEGLGGNDTYIVDHAGDVVIEAANGGTDLVKSSVSFTLGNNLEQLTLTGTAAINATGNAQDNILIGNDAANVLDGLGGADRMEGKGGNDTYIVGNVSDLVVEAAGGGTDHVKSSVSYTLGNNLEQLTLTGTAAIDGTGNALDNVLTGNDAANILDGGVGADRMEGKGGNDTYFVGNAYDTVIEAAGGGTDHVKSTVSHTLALNVELLTLIGTAAINGTGNTLDNTLVGNDAANVLDGGVGADRMEGKGGDDTYVVGNAADLVIEAAGGGTDLVQSTISYALGANLENLTLTGTAAINATGNAGQNRLVGNSAANTLDGLGGADTMEGLGGDDIYIVDNAGDLVVEGSNAGTDQVRSAVSYTLGNNVENLMLTGSAAIDGTGNSLRNRLVGNSAANVLDGAGGADTLEGLGGNDTYIVDNSGDTIIEVAGGGTDLVKSSVDYTLAAEVENLTLTGSSSIDGYGNSLGNQMVGNSAANILKGGSGADLLQGGAGADALYAGNDSVTDRFVFTATSDSGRSFSNSGTWDKLYDFSESQNGGDLIDLSQLDADPRAGDQALRFVTSFSTATGGAPVGQVRAYDWGDNVRVEVDINGDRQADMVFEAIDVRQLTASDFIL